MKITKQLLAAGITALLCCSIGKAQIIYSNDFTLGGTNDINNTPPTTANNFAGGTNTAVWLDTLGTNDTGVLQANGVDNTTVVGTSWVLPFVPQTNNIYLLTTIVDFTNNPGGTAWIGAGFAEEYTNNAGLANARFSDSVAGIDWAILTESTGNVQWFSGPKGVPVAGLFNANNAFTAGPGTNIVQLLLNTKPALWAIACYVNGVQLGTNFIFTAAANPTNLIRAVGVSQTTLTAPTAVQYLNLALITTEAPFITTQPIATTTIGAGSRYTNSVTVTADTNGGTLSYQWYANNTPLINGVNNVSGANTNVLTINPITTVNQLSNYYVIVSNNFGMATSALASVTVLTNPVPITTGGPITLFSGTGSTVGSSPAFSMVAVGAPPLTYQWTTNSVAVAGATNTSLAFTNLQAGSPATFACVVSNTFGATNVTWAATYSNAPTAAYPQTVLGDIPFDLWRLDETNDGNGNLGAVSHDYQSGNNGVYTNVTLAETGYNSLEPSETSLAVTGTGNQPSCVKLVANSDLAGTMTNGVNAGFTVEAWANCVAANGTAGGAPVVSQGLFGASRFFLGADTGTTKHYQFYVRNAAGTIFSADATNGVSLPDFTWHHLAGVCDEAHSNISLYIDGVLAASASITPATGLFESGMPVAIGAGIRAGASDYNVPFTGNISDVAIYSHPLSIGQVINHFTAANNATVPVSFTSALPPATFPYLANQTLTIPLTAAGSASLGYYWSNVTTASVISSGSTTNTTLNVSLSIPNASTSLNGDQLELVVTNGNSSTNVNVTLFNPPAPVTLDSSNPILYTNVFNGGTWSQMGMAATEANVLVGGTNSLWIDELGTNDTTGTVTASGVVTSTQADGWVLPFVPHPGYTYTINGAFTFTGSPGNWIGIGFSTKILTNGTDGRFNGGAPGDDWMIITESSGNIQYFAGPSGGGGTIFSANSAFSPLLGAHAVQIVLDTTGTQWKASGFIDGVQKGSTFSYTVANTPTNIVAVGIAQNAAINPAFYQWNSFALSQVAPGGVPPYLLSPLPPTNVNLTGTVTIPATAYGSAPFGYYWSNNATVIASGSTNAMSPLAVNLSVPGTSLTAGQLKLVVTNAFGTNITSITLVNPINPNPGPILYSVAGSQLNLSWPTNLGWILQTQTNSRGVGINTNWLNVTNSSTTNQVAVTINPTNGSVFFRLIHP